MEQPAQFSIRREQIFDTERFRMISGDAYLPVFVSLQLKTAAGIYLVFAQQILQEIVELPQ